MQPSQEHFVAARTQRCDLDSNGTADTRPSITGWPCIARTLATRQQYRKSGIPGPR
jgi:hypothetical protein